MPRGRWGRGLEVEWSRCTGIDRWLCSKDICMSTWAGKPVLVTGGAGFIGSHLAEALVEAGAEVTVLDDFSSGRPENLAPVRERIRIIEADVRDRERVRAATRGQQVVFHLAANADVPRSV